MVEEEVKVISVGSDKYGSSLYHSCCFINMSKGSMVGVEVKVIRVGSHKCGWYTLTVLSKSKAKLQN